MDDKITFKTETVHKLLQESFKDKEKTKISNDALKLMAELLRVYVAEGAARAGQQAKAESSLTVEIEHLEKILPQLPNLRLLQNALVFQLEETRRQFTLLEGKLCLIKVPARKNPKCT